MSEKNNPLLYRYPVNSRFVNKGQFSEQQPTEVKTVDFGESVTDKESYRLTMASKRGSLANLASSGQKGYYMFDDGVYKVEKDFSYILRKDVSEQEIDEYIANMKENLEKADKELAEEIKSQIAYAEAEKEKIKAKEENTNQPNE